MEMYLDTEFIFVQKNKCSFLQVAIYDSINKEILDFRLSPHLNGWEKRYVQKAINGDYGESAKKVFKQVQRLLEASDKPVVYNKRLHKYKKINTNVKALNSRLAGYSFKVWDQSSDKLLFKGNDVTIIDLQVKWTNKFGGKGIGLCNAYKTVLFNLGIKDKYELLKNAHLAHTDVIMLALVDDFIDNFDFQLKPIPIHVSELEKQVNKQKNHLQECYKRLDAAILNTELSDSESIKKINKIKKNIERGQVNITNLQSVETYEDIWW